ncbi:hypothetical protein ACP4OV_013516 [Aristida adscensionis]
MEHLLVSSSSSSLRFGYVVSALLLLLVTLLLLFKLLRDDQRENAPRLPPGPWRLPVIGSLHHLIANPLKHRALADLARRCDAPVMYLRLGELHAVVVSSPAAAREVMKTHDAAFATRPMCLTVRLTAHEGLGVIFAPYGDHWRRLRRICAAELLGAARVQSLRAVREDEAARLAAAVAAAAAASGEHQQVNVSALVTAFATDSVMRTIMGERFKRRDEFIRTLDEAVKKASPGMSAGDLFPSSRLVRAVSGTARRAVEFQRKLHELVDGAIKQHKERTAAADDAAAAGGSTDLMDVLLTIHKEGGHDSPLTMGTVKALVLDLFGAGSETTYTTLLWTMSELMRNPKVMQKAQAEVRQALQGKVRVTEDDLINVKYLKLVIKEGLRLHAPTPLLIPRECMESRKILGYDIPQGTMVLVNAWAISRDPKYWDDAEEFKPERFQGVNTDFKGMDFEFTPFGAGRRMCPGVTFAQVNMELALAALLYHFDWELPAGVAPSKLDMTEEMGTTVRRKRDLYLCPIINVPPPPM